MTIKSSPFPTKTWSEWSERQLRNQPVSVDMGSCRRLQLLMQANSLFPVIDFTNLGHLKSMKRPLFLWKDSDTNKPSGAKPISACDQRSRESLIRDHRAFIHALEERWSWSAWPRISRGATGIEKIESKIWFLCRGKSTGDIFVEKRWTINILSQIVIMQYLEGKF